MPSRSLDRNGRDYNHVHLLSQKTLDNKSGKKPKETCPKCGRKFSRLDTHLKNRAICKDTQTNSPAASTDPDPTPAVIPPSPSHLSQQPQLNQHHQHRQHLSKVQKLRNELKKALTEKNVAKKKLRQLRRVGSDPETVKQLACEFYSLVCTHSRLSKVAKGLERKESQKQQRKECRKDLYKFAKN